MLPLFNTQVLLHLMHGLKFGISKWRAQMLLHPGSVWCIHCSSNGIGDGVRHCWRWALWSNGRVAAAFSGVNRCAPLRLSITFILHLIIRCCHNSLMRILSQIRTADCCITLFFQHIRRINSWLIARYLLFQGAWNIFILNLSSLELSNDWFLFCLVLAYILWFSYFWALAQLYRWSIFLIVLDQRWVFWFKRTSIASCRRLVLWAHNLWVSWLWYLVVVCVTIQDH